MLQLYKNSVITDATASQAEVRQKELDFYTNIFALFGGSATFMAGITFEGLTKVIPPDTPPSLETWYLVLNTLNIGLDLCIIVWTTLCCTWGPGMALRGPEGLLSFHKTVDFLKDETLSIYLTYALSVICFFGSAVTQIWVFPNGESITAWVATGIMLLILFIVLVEQIRLELRIGGVIFSHFGADGKINGFQQFSGIHDLDSYLHSQGQPLPASSSTSGPEAARQAPEVQAAMMPGLYDTKVLDDHHPA